MITRAVWITTWAVLLVVGGCAGAGYPTGQTQLPSESCPDVESLASCEARLEDLKAALARTLPPTAAAIQAQAMEQRPQAMQMETAAPERQSDSEEPSGSSDHQDHKRGPDCSAARDLGDRICDLADAICALAARPGAPHEIMDRCTSARASCERARSEVNNACPR